MSTRDDLPPSQSAPGFVILRERVIPSSWDGRCIKCHAPLTVPGVYCVRHRRRRSQ